MSVTKPWLDDRIAANGRPVRENFADWFGNGVKRAGEPLMLFHGTNHAFNAFDIEKSAVGAHFSVNRQVASDDFADRDGGLVLPVYLAIQNPLRVPDLGDWGAFDLIETLQSAGGLTEQQAQDLRDAVNASEFSDADVHAALITNGFDGLVYLNRGEGFHNADGGGAGWDRSWSDAQFKRTFPEASDAYIAFRPEQIKSAIGNSGLYAKDSASLDDQAGAVAWLRNQACMGQTVRRAMTRGARL